MDIGCSHPSETNFTARQYFQERLVRSALDWFSSSIFFFVSFPSSVRSNSHLFFQFVKSLNVSQHSPGLTAIVLLVNQRRRGNNAKFKNFLWLEICLF